MTVEGLPPISSKRWYPRQKAEVVAAVEGGLLTTDEACARYALTLEEFGNWRFALARAGLKALRVTHVQVYRTAFERQRRFGS